MRLALLSCVVLWIGAALALSRGRWFERRPLTERLRPYAPGDVASGARSGVLSVDSFRDVIGPLSREIGGRLARLFGVDEDLATRLERVHSSDTVTAFRVRQLGWTCRRVRGRRGARALLRDSRRAFGVLFVLGLPLLDVPAHRATLGERIGALAAACVPRVADPRRAARHAAVSRLFARRGAEPARRRGARAAAGRDLARVCGRIKQGLSEVDALREWSALERVDALDRLVSILVLNREAGDLGRLISEEARSVRRDVHRELVETVERRGQQVWIPVTVATLVPGVIFLAIPFIEAMRLFTDS